jgi:hypothetical protein
MTMTFDNVSSDSDNDLFKEIQDSDSQHASHDTVLNETANQDYALLEFWESEHTRLAYSAVSREMTTSLSDSFDNYIGRQGVRHRRHLFQRHRFRSSGTRKCRDPFLIEKIHRR